MRGLRQRGLSWTVRRLVRLEAVGQFSRHVRLSRNLVAWVEREVEATPRKLGSCDLTGALYRRNLAPADNLAYCGAWSARI